MLIGKEYDRTISYVLITLVQAVLTIVTVMVINSMPMAMFLFSLIVIIIMGGLLQLSFDEGNFNLRISPDGSLWMVAILQSIAIGFAFSTVI